MPADLASGGEGFTMLAELPKGLVGLVDVEALVRYLRLLPEPVRPAREPRFVRR